MKDAITGQRPVGYVVLKTWQVRDSEELRSVPVAMVREEIGAVATFRDCTVARGLPKTRSGKIPRKTMRQIADGQGNVAVPSTIKDPAVLEAPTPPLRPEG